MAGADKRLVELLRDDALKAFEAASPQPQSH
jgi:hypothetical protein